MSAQVQMLTGRRDSWFWRCAGVSGLEGINPLKAPFLGEIGDSLEFTVISVGAAFKLAPTELLAQVQQGNLIVASPHDQHLRVIGGCQFFHSLNRAQL